MPSLTSKLFSPRCRCRILAALLISTPAIGTADVVLDWNAAVGTCIESLTHSDLTRAAEARTYALMHLALWEALLSAGPENPAGAIAAATAAHDILVIAFPRESQRFDALLAAHLATVRDATVRDCGTELGRSAAIKILRDRTPDGTIQPGRLPPGMLLFALKSSAQFRADEPEYIRFGSARFRQNDFVRRLPRYSAEEKSAIVRTRLDSPVVTWNRVAAEGWRERSGATLERARGFALLNVALADACFAAIESRAYFRTVHPDTTVLDPIVDHELTDAGPFTVERERRPQPGHPSTAAALAGAAAAVLVFHHGGDARQFSLPPANANTILPAAPRAYARITDAAKEHAIAGAFAGRETFEACAAGYDQGFKVGDYILHHSRFGK